jgi:hypothetical protein
VVFQNAACVLADDDICLDVGVVLVGQFFGLVHQFLGVYTGIGQPLVELTGGVAPAARTEVARPEVDDVQDGELGVWME